MIGTSVMKELIKLRAFNTKIQKNHQILRNLMASNKVKPFLSNYGFFCEMFETFTKEHSPFGIYMFKVNKVVSFEPQLIKSPNSAN